jgi:regulator of RNase E activity RraB
MEKKLTAVEWLESIVNGMIENGGDYELLAVIEHIQQAKEMEKKQIIDAVNFGDELCKIF